MSRPKGIKQKRDETKYWLPAGVVLASKNTDIYNKSTKLIFIDSIYGEFISSFRAIQGANASTHPDAVNIRRASTNTIRYGGPNPHNSPEIRKKAKKTMLERYGVENALCHPDFLKKSQETLYSNYGVINTMKSEIIKSALKDNNIEKYGVSNPAMTQDVQNKMKQTSLARYGRENAGSHPMFIEKAFKTLAKNGNGRFTSQGELEMLEFVRSLGIDANKGYIGGADPKELDIKIPEKMIAIEYNGAYWHSDAIKHFNPNDHYNKMKICSNQGYKLLQFFDFEWNNRKLQIQSFLRSALGKNEIKIHGRKTELREVLKLEAKDFLEKYHILGKVQFKVAYGLYFNNELVSMITINKHHRNNEEWVLNRYVGKTNVTVAGGLKKLCDYASREFGQISTWIDLRMSDGSGWEKMGWKKVSILKPDYFYFNIKTHQIVPKQSRQKKKLNTPLGMTEREHAKLDSLARIYDCGKIKLVYQVISIKLVYQVIS